MKLSEYIAEDRIILDADVKSAEDVLKQLCNVMEHSGTVCAAQDLFRKVQQREELGSTGIGEGVAVPHIHTEANAMSVAVLITRDSLDFDAIDGKPCRLFFMVVSPDERRAEYLQLMATVSTLIHHSELRERLLEAHNPAEVMQAIAEAEEKVACSTG